MELYALELRTADWRRLLAWYREVLGLRVLVRVEDDRYALLAAGPAKIAIVEARREELTPAVVSIDRLIFDTDDFDAAVLRLERFAGRPPAVSTEAEGFRQCATTDPDGRGVRLVAWPDRPGRHQGPSA